MTPPELIYGPAGSGKTRWTIEKCASLVEDHSPVTILLPSQPLITDFKQRLFTSGEIRGALGLEFHTFYSLARKYSQITGIEQQELNQHQLRFALTSFLESRQSDYPELCAQDLTPGFVTALLGYFKDLEDGALDAPSIARLSTHPELRDHSGRLPEIHQLYGDFLNHLLSQGYISREQLILQTGKMLQRDEIQSISGRSFLIDGFYDFTPVQRQIIETLVQQASYTGITLLNTTKKLFEYVKPVWQWLNEIIRRNNGTVEMLEKSGSFLPEIESLFEKANSQHQPENYSCIEAAGIGLEIQAVTREVKQDILSGTYSPDEVTVLFRNEDDYYTRLTASFRREGIPIEGNPELPVGTNPAINAILQWYEVLRNNYARPDVIRWLQSDYIAPAKVSTDYCVARLNQISKKAQILEGIEAWKTGLNGILETTIDNGNSQSDSQLSKSDQEIVHGFLNLLERLPDAKTAMWKDHIQDFRDVVKAANFKQKILGESRSPKKGTDEDLAARDFRAYRQMMELLDSLEVLSDEFQFAEIPTADFARKMQDLLHKTPYQTELSSSSGVTVSTIEKARGRFWKKVYLVGMVDGVFPVQWRAHPLVKLNDRIYLNNLLGMKKQIVEHRADLREEQLLFYIAVTRATESLRMSTITGSEEIIPSTFYEEFNRYYYPVTEDNESESGKPVRRVTPELLETEPERTWLQLDLMSHLVKTGDFDEGIFPFRAESLQHLMDVIHQRESSRFGVYDGHLQSKKIHDDIAESLLQSGKPMSAGRLEIYYTSPFRYFAEYLLHLAEIEEVAEELPPQDRGRLLHTILERFYSRLSGEFSGVMTPVNRNEVFDMLDEIITAVFESYARKPIPIPDLLWEREKELLRQYVHNAVEFFTSEYPWSDMNFQPDQFEMAFGMETDDSLPPLRIPVEDMEITFRGIIDRLDINKATGEYTVVDYKTSRGKSRQDFYNGKAMQLQVYAMAAGQILAEYDVPVRLSYYSLRNNKEDGKLKLKPDEKSELFTTTTNLIMHAIRQMMSGVFNPVEGECDPYCPVKQICGCDEHRVRMKF